jgi:hypothetical protein
VAEGPIHGCIARWHACLRGELHGGLDSLLHPDCVFLSPIVFTPQRGRDITKLYLAAAGSALAGASIDAGHGTPTDGTPTVEAGSPFRYVKQILDGHQAMLEFETELDGKYVNGVDIITCDDDGMITEFKVMIRPLQAIDAVHGQMRAALDRLNG